MVPWGWRLGKPAVAPAVTAVARSAVKLAAADEAPTVVPAATAVAHPVKLAVAVVAVEAAGDVVAAVAHDASQAVVGNVGLGVGVVRVPP